MEKDILLQISNRIKERRREKNITVQELASRANVSKGLISQIENSRTIPSLIVLIAIIKALEVDLNEFFKDIRTKDNYLPVLVKRSDEYECFEKEHVSGFSYRRIFSQITGHSTIDFVLLELDPYATRPPVQTEAFEFKYILTGQVVYQFDEEYVTLNQGDSVLFDGRIPHSPKNPGDEKASMLVVYFFEEEN